MFNADDDDVFIRRPVKVSDDDVDDNDDDDNDDNTSDDVCLRIL